MLTRFAVGALVLLWGAIITWWVSPFSEKRKEQYRERQRVIGTLRRISFDAVHYAAKAPYSPQYVGKQAEFHGSPGNGNAANLTRHTNLANGVLDKHRFDLPDHYWMWGNKFAEDFAVLAATDSEEQYVAALKTCIQDYLHLAGRGGRKRLERIAVHSENETAITGA